MQFHLLCNFLEFRVLHCPCSCNRVAHELVSFGSRIELGAIMLWHKLFLLMYKLWWQAIGLGHRFNGKSSTFNKKKMDGACKLHQILCGDAMLHHMHLHILSPPLGLLWDSCPFPSLSSLARCQHQTTPDTSHRTVARPPKTSPAAGHKVSDGRLWRVRFPARREAACARFPVDGRRTTGGEREP